jgi:CP family cyanate transporter-like MFS transporter
LRLPNSSDLPTVAAPADGIRRPAEASRAVGGWSIARAWTALVLTGAGMRVGVGSLGAELPEVRAQLHLGSAQAALAVALPVLCFSGFGALAVWVPRVWSLEWGVLVGALLGGLGLIARASAPTATLFLLAALPAFAGPALHNVLLPALLRHADDGQVQLPPAVAAGSYTVALAAGSAAAAGLSVPLDHALSSWRWSLGLWGGLQLLAVPLWLSAARRAPRAARWPAGEAPPPAGRRASPRTPRRVIAALLALFGAQSVQSYCAFGWFTTRLVGAGTGADSAGAWLAVYTLAPVPVYLAAARIPLRRLPGLVVALSALSATGYAALLLAPEVGGPALAVCGVGSGCFALALRLIGEQGADGRETARVSALVQGGGYLLAWLGATGFGLVVGGAGGWPAGTLLLLAAAAITALAGVRAGVATRRTEIDGRHLDTR